ncbi:hypothetical protein Pfo_009024 [Paulownia fortunei]|nr:hypothetical protein Pfo_009024 [Paulownia fortunei]
MGGSRKVVGAALSVSFLWFLLLVSLVDWNNRRDIITIPSTRSVELLKPTGSEEPGLHQDSDLNYVSKRRVPNGPDPIHNRRTGTSKLPPT